MAGHLLTDLDGRSQSVNGKIPREVAKVFQPDPGPGRIAFVEGHPGSGKTTFVVELTFALGQPCILGRSYLNVVSSESALFAQFPKMRADTGIANLGPALEELQVRQAVSRDALHRLEESIRAGKEGRDLLDQLRGGNPSGDDHRIQVASKPRRRQRYPEVGEWDERELPPEEPEVVEPEEPPVLPEIARLYEHVARAVKIPVLLIIDPIDALARHRGILTTRLIETIRSDLVDRGQADLVAVFERSPGILLDQLADVILRFDRIEGTSRRLGLVTIERTRGRGIRQHQFTFKIEDGHAWVSPSDDDVVDWLVRESGPPRDGLGQSDHFPA